MIATFCPPLADPVRAVHWTRAFVFVVAEASSDTAIRLVGRVSMVAPAVLSSENWPVPLALVALTRTRMRPSLGNAVKAAMVVMETVQVVVETMVGSAIPSPLHWVGSGR